MAFLNYTAPFEDDNDLNIDNDPNIYNPYWFMKYPRIPLFILSVRLPLQPLQQYAVKCVNERYGPHSPNLNGNDNDNDNDKTIEAFTRPSSTDKYIIIYR